jgi:hypothetical protein
MQKFAAAIREKGLSIRTARGEAGDAKGAAFPWVSVLSLAYEILRGYVGKCLETVEPVEIAAQAQDKHSGKVHTLSRKAVRVAARRLRVDMSKPNEEEATKAVETLGPMLEPEDVEAVRLDFAVFAMAAPGDGGEAPVAPPEAVPEIDVPVSGALRAELLNIAADGYVVCATFDAGQATNGDIRVAAKRIAAAFGGKFPPGLKPLGVKIERCQDDSASSELRRMLRIIEGGASSVVELEQPEGA